MTYSTVKQFGSDLLKLTLNGSPRWRLLVMGSILALSGAAVYANQLYARKSEVDAVQREINEVQKEQFRSKVRDLTNDLLDARRDQCEAKREGRKAGAWQQHIEGLVYEYRKLTGFSFAMPDCEDV